MLSNSILPSSLLHLNINVKGIKKEKEMPKNTFWASMTTNLGTFDYLYQVS